MSLISVKNLTFRYDGSLDNVFENVSFNIDTDWKLGLIGRNGKGKTTFLKLLLGEYEYNGSISKNVRFDYFPFEVKDKSKMTIEIVNEIAPNVEDWEIIKELNLLNTNIDILYRDFNILSGGEQVKILLISLFLKGNNFLPEDKYRLDYQMFVYTFPSDFWGIGYENGANDANKGSYKRVKFQFKPSFLFRLSQERSVFLGPVVDIEWVNSFSFSDVSKLEGQDKDIANIGIGFNFSYDTRDFVLNAYKGNFFRWEQMFYPDVLGNKYHFIYTDLTYSAYRQVWKGGVLAMELHSLFNYGKVPWTMLAQVGVQGRMRGYYEGRYRDRNILEGQVELRQRIKGRHGIAIWGGMANVFPGFRDIRLKQILPNYGIGYRWEFKTRVNVRLDFGFTKDNPNFTFNINEAF